MTGSNGGASGLVDRVRTAINTLRGSLSGASRSHYKERALDENRADGERPYEDWPDERVKSEYVNAIGRVRDADEGGLHLSPVIDRGWNLSQEWNERGNDPDELDEALEEAGYDV